MFKKRPAMLEDLLKELQEYNSFLEKCLNRKNARSILATAPAIIPSITSQTISTTGGYSSDRSPASVQDPNILGRHVVNEVPTSLYTALSKLSPCNCHRLYLRLETHRDLSQTWHTAIPVSADSQPGIKFSVLVTSKGTESSLTTNDQAEGYGHCQEIFLDIIHALVDEKCLTFPSCPGLCGAHFGDQQERENYILDNFLIQRVPNCQKVTRDGDYTSAVISLRQLLHEKNLPLYDRILLAAKLGDAALMFHSSPWIKLWTASTITFFTGYEKLKQPASWTPHIASSLTLDHLLMPNDTDVYRLGMILLEVGGIDMNELAGKKEQVPVALGDLTRLMGMPYKTLVKRCFDIYENLRKGCCIDQERHMIQLFGDIKDLRVQAEEDNPGKAIFLINFSQGFLADNR
jgi:hypothetical protein